MPKVTELGCCEAGIQTQMRLDLELACLKFYCLIEEESEAQKAAGMTLIPLMSLHDFLPLLTQGH